MNFNDIDLGWNENAYVWVGPKDGTDWEDITGMSKDRNKIDWRPAEIVGFNEDKWGYGTVNDPRRIFLIGSTFGYGIAKFQLGSLMSEFQPETLTESAAATESFAGPRI